MRVEELFESVFFWKSLRFPNIESPSPPRFSAGEKVAKPDEGAVLAMPLPVSTLRRGEMSLRRIYNVAP